MRAGFITAWLGLCLEASCSLSGIIGEGSPHRVQYTQWIDHYWFYLKGTLNEISISRISTCPHLSTPFSIQADENSLKPESRPSLHRPATERTKYPRIDHWPQRSTLEHFTANASTIQLGGVLSGLWSAENGHFVSSVVIPLTHKTQT